MTQDVVFVASHYSLFNKDSKINILSKGLINNTYLICNSEIINKPSFILQRINSQVFTSPISVIKDFEIVTSHLNDKLTYTIQNNKFINNISFPSLIPTTSGEPSFVDVNNSFWRAQTYIPNTFTPILPIDNSLAYQLGYILGIFHDLIGDLDHNLLCPNFSNIHDTPNYISQLKQTKDNQTLPHYDSKISSILKDLFEIIYIYTSKYNYFIDSLFPLSLPRSLIHGDPKISNVLFDLNLSTASSIIDLDTVHLSSPLLDLADAVRSSCYQHSNDVNKSYFNFPLFESILEGYFATNSSVLLSSDPSTISKCIMIIPFELGIRFLTDYLQGNIYFRVEYSDHNLYRAIKQFNLFCSIESNQNEIVSILENLLK